MEEEEENSEWNRQEEGDSGGRRLEWGTVSGEGLTSLRSLTGSPMAQNGYETEFSPETRDCWIYQVENFER